MENHLLPTWALSAFLLPFCSLAQSHGTDSTFTTIGFGVGAAYEQNDLGSLNAQLATAGLHGAPRIPIMAKGDVLVAMPHMLITISANGGSGSDRTDTSLVRSHALNAQICVGYPIVRTDRMLLAPMVGYRLSQFTYEHYMDLSDGSFDGSLRNSGHDLRSSLVRNNLLLGAYWSYGKAVAVAVQGGYIIPLGNGTWHTDGNNTELSNGPAVDPGFFIGASLMFQTTRNRRLL